MLHQRILKWEFNVQPELEPEPGLKWCSHRKKAKLSQLHNESGALLFMWQCWPPSFQMLLRTYSHICLPSCKHRQSTKSQLGDCMMKPSGTMQVQLGITNGPCWTPIYTIRSWQGEPEKLLLRNSHCRMMRWSWSYSCSRPSKPEKSTVCWQFNKRKCTFDVSFTTRAPFALAATQQSIA